MLNFKTLVLALLLVASAAAFTVTQYSDSACNKPGGSYSFPSNECYVVSQSGVTASFKAVCTTNANSATFCARLAVSA